MKHILGDSCRFVRNGDGKMLFLEEMSMDEYHAMTEKTEKIPTDCIQPDTPGPAVNPFIEAVSDTCVLEHSELSEMYQRYQRFGTLDEAPSYEDAYIRTKIRDSYSCEDPRENALLVINNHIEGGPQYKRPQYNAASPYYQTRKVVLIEHIKMIAQVWFEIFLTYKIFNIPHGIY